MGKKSCTTTKDLQTEIMRRANKALNKDIAPYVENKLKEHVKKDVYATYSPVEYERREEDGGLVDDDNIKHKVRTDNRTLYVYERSPIEGPRLDAPNWVSQNDSLAQLIEQGAHNPWTHKRYRWTNPRPFIENTQKDINYRYADIVKMLRNRINHDN